MCKSRQSDAHTMSPIWFCQPLKIIIWTPEMDTMAIWISSASAQSHRWAWNSSHAIHCRMFVMRMKWASECVSLAEMIHFCLGIQNGRMCWRFISTALLPVYGMPLYQRLDNEKEINRLQYLQPENVTQFGLLCYCSKYCTSESSSSFER